MIAALYVETGGVYYGLPDVDPWDEARDARLYAGPWPVVAHPPCGPWSAFARINESRWGTRVGDDEGCFSLALRAVRLYGGVLEHPAGSLAWERFGLPRPGTHGWTFSMEELGATTEVSQVAYGHPARKRTWLYSVACELPQLDWGEPEAMAIIGGRGTKGLPEGRYRICHEPASRTPPAFRDVLLAMARSAAMVPRG